MTGHLYPNCDHRIAVVLVSLFLHHHPRSRLFPERYHLYLARPARSFRHLLYLCAATGRLEPAGAERQERRGRGVLHNGRLGHAYALEADHVGSRAATRGRDRYVLSRFFNPWANENSSSDNPLPHPLQAMSSRATSRSSRTPKTRASSTSAPSGPSATRPGPRRRTAFRLGRSGR